MGSLDLPDQPDEPGQAGRIRDADAGAGAGRSRIREIPDPEERGRVYAAVRAHVSAETPDAIAWSVSAETPGEASPGERPDGNDRRSYWDEVPRFLEARDDQERHGLDERRVVVDRSADPAGSYRSDGGSCLNPERHAQTTEAVGLVREAEPAISANVQATEQDNRYGGWLEGFEFRLKGEDRLKEKVAERLEGEPDKSPTEILRKVSDAIRYTFCLRPETYTEGYYDIRECLENRGYQMYESRNSWDGAEYKGINTRWVTPEGQRFEVQFHTPESYHAKQYVTHCAYERIRNPLVSDDERAELKAFQRDVCSYIQMPNGARDIPDFKKEGF